MDGFFVADFDFLKTIPSLFEIVEIVRHKKF